MLNQDYIHHKRVYPMVAAIGGALTGDFPKSWFLALGDDYDEAIGEYVQQQKQLAKLKDKA